MLHVYCGSDTALVRQQALEATNQAVADGATLTVLDRDTYTSGVISDAARGTSLFGDISVYLVDTPSEVAEFMAEVKDNLAALAESPNVFVVVEGALLAPAKKPYQKYAATFTELKAASGERFNTFAIADAVAQKDKKKLWVLLQTAKQAGISDEEIIGVIWWQLKSLRLAALAPTADAADMKPYPFNKAKRALATIPAAEAVRLSHSLLDMYHQARLGETELDRGLERWCLTL